MITKFLVTKSQKVKALMLGFATTITAAIMGGFQLVPHEAAAPA
jgi:hypothetical protein